MDDKLKTEIAKAFEPPAPRDRDRFIRILPRPRISTSGFVWRQLPFIKKSVWLLSVLIFVPALFGARFVGEDTVWIVSAFTPFLALLFITESAKSSLYGMAELEMAARFSLKSVVMARLGILGVFDLVLLGILIPLCQRADTASLLQVGLYLFVPYLLSAGASLTILRRFRRREAVPGCMAAAVLVSGGNITLRVAASFLFTADYFLWWTLSALLLLGSTGKELRRLIDETEELPWNFA